MFELNRNLSLYETMDKLLDQFRDYNFLIDLKVRAYGGRYDPEFVETCFKLIEDACVRVNDVNISFVFTKDILYDKYSIFVTQINRYLSFVTPESAAAGLLSSPYIDDDVLYNLLNLSYYALVILDSTVRNRFFTAYILWYNSIKVGISGYCKRLNRILPYYITFFGNRIFLINPIIGEVKAFSRKKKNLRGVKIIKLATNTKSNNKVICAMSSTGMCIPLLEENNLGSLTEIHKCNVVGIDRKYSERTNKKNSSFTIKETPWHSTSLDKIVFNDVQCTPNILIHSFICLMVYGIDSMKYGIMEGNSILTIDHIDGDHANNSIDNLQLLTRNTNLLKKNNPQVWVFDYFTFWEKQVAQAKINQKNYNFRKYSI